jgi:hypothetical protein
MMSVALTPGPELVPAAPSVLFPSDIEPNPNLAQYGVTPDGQRFLGLAQRDRRGGSFTFLLNWLNVGEATRTRLRE